MVKDFEKLFVLWFKKTYGYTPYRRSDMGNHYHCHTARVAWQAWEAAHQLMSEVEPC